MLALTRDEVLRCLPNTDDRCMRRDSRWQLQAGGPPDNVAIPSPARGPGFGGLRPARVLAALLLLAGIVLPLWVRSYARETPRLWGFPFFYWYQLAWVFIAALLVGSAFALVTHDERIHRADLTGGAVLPDDDALDSSDSTDSADDGRPS